MLQKVLKISRIKYRGSYVPKIKLSAFWLNDIGFSCGKPFVLDYSREFISIKLLNFCNASDVQKSCIQNVSVTLNKTLVTPSINVRGKWFSEIGFHVGSKVLINANYGDITIVPLEP